VNRRDERDDLGERAREGGQAITLTPSLSRPTGEGARRAGEGALALGAPAREPADARSEGSWDPRYAGFFDCFNGGRYFEAHEVLEGLWLTKRGHPDGYFYQGLIQLAGAFVHVEKRRPGPAVALLHRAEEHLGAYPPRHLGLVKEEVLGLIRAWIGQIQAAPETELDGRRPRLMLQRPAAGE
jgi:predicted metal-dependent hydrolase